MQVGGISGKIIDAVTLVSGYAKRLDSRPDPERPTRHPELLDC
jgi:hypothetical protein